MLSWLLIIILAYFFFSLASFGDKLVLSSNASAKSYTFFACIVNIFAVFLIPFAKFSFPSNSSLIWIFLESIVFIGAIYFGFAAIKKFPVSQVVPASGALQPIMIFFLTFLFFGPEFIKTSHWLAFIILLLGGFIISSEGKFKISKEYFKLVFISSLMFSLDYVLLKMVFLREPFLQGLIWTRILVFIFALLFLIDKKFRGKVFSRNQILNKKTGTFFIATQSFGAAAGLLQNFAISLAPFSYLAVVNSLRGVQYVFLFVITLIFSYFYPTILREESSKKLIIKKIVAIFLIMVGLLILFL